MNNVFGDHNTKINGLIMCVRNTQRYTIISNKQERVIFSILQLIILLIWIWVAKMFQRAPISDAPVVVMLKLE